MLRQPNRVDTWSPLSNTASAVYKYGSSRPFQRRTGANSNSKMAVWFSIGAVFVSPAIVISTCRAGPSVHTCALTWALSPWTCGVTVKPLPPQ